MNIKDCEGCYNDNALSATLCEFRALRRDPKEFKKIPMCPCVTCLVKMMCRYGCPEYNDFVTKTNRSMREEYENEKS